MSCLPLRTQHDTLIMRAAVMLTDFPLMFVRGHLHYDQEFARIKFFFLLLPLLSCCAQLVVTKGHQM